MSIFQNTFNKHLKLLMEHLNIKEATFTNTKGETWNTEGGPVEYMDKDLIRFFAELENKLEQKQVTYKDFLNKMLSFTDEEVKTIITDYKPVDKMDEETAQDIREYLELWEWDEKTKVLDYDAETIGYIVSVCHLWYRAKTEFDKLIDAAYLGEKWVFEYPALWDVTSRKEAVSKLKSNKRMTYKTFIEAARDKGFWYKDQEGLDDYWLHGDFPTLPYRERDRSEKQF